MKTFIRIVTIIIFLFALNGNRIYGQDTATIVRAGLRSSVYGFDTFPDSAWWYNATSNMASNFGEEVSPAVIWILGYTSNGGCHLNFPNPNPDSSYPHITFANKDQNEKFLEAFDSNGVKVWLQVEAGFADVSTLIDLVLTQYAHHKSVIGFGVDVEWYKTSSSNNNEGEAVTDEEAQAWSAKIKSYNNNYLLFTKHWLIEKMPPTFRDDIVFVDDSQIFTNMEEMISEFEEWGNAFAPAKVAFQYGYESDKSWWQNFSNPPKAIGDEIIKRIPNASDLYWVDFTAYDIWPKDYNPTSVNNKGKIEKNFLLNQNYPNPFNPTTTIVYTIPSLETLHATSQRVRLKVYDILGKVVATIVNERQPAGNYSVTFDASNLPSGIYFYQLKVGAFSQVRKMMLIK